MTDNTSLQGQPVSPEPDGRDQAGLVRLTHLIYLLHTIALIIGLTSAATIIGAFVFGLPSIAAVILNYVKRSETRGTFLASHFHWQIRTFWFALLWCVVSALLFVTVIGIPIAIAIVALAGVWVIYRVARGWMALNDARPVPA